jgi:hypothetical protein
MTSLYNLLEEMIQTNSLIKELEQAIKKLLPNVLIDRNNIVASTVLDARNRPIVHIDSKAKPTALWIAVEELDGTIKVIVKTIVNNKESNLPGHGQKLFEAIAEVIRRHKDTPFEVVVDRDVSGGFWRRMESKYPDITFTFTDND